MASKNKSRSSKKMRDKENWVDFTEIKSKISMEMVLDHYGLLKDMKTSGKNLVSCCPIHKGSNPRQFSVCLERNIWNCFGNCKSGGNILDFVARMENISIRDAGLLLKNWFLGNASGQKAPLEKPPLDKVIKSEKLVRKENNGCEKHGGGEQQNNQENGSQGGVNPPLKFELKTLEPDHPFFAEQGIEPATVEYFGLGFCSRGLMKGRIVIPIHDELNRLTAYCGRAVSSEQIKEEGKYKLPPNFVKSAVVYNLHRQKKPDQLILVESFLSVFKLYQAGFSNVAALMGSQLSEEQEKLLAAALGPHGQILLMLDYDEAGIRCTNECLLSLGRKLFVKAIDISPYGLKPHRLAPEQIKDLI